MKPTRLALALSLAAAFANPAAAAYFRYPAIRADQVVFTAEGDLWKVAADGGQAQRLTTHPAAKIMPAISHDGKWLAFSAAYEGSAEAYVMPAAGGLPRRISFENGIVQVLGWTRDGEVLVSMQHSSGPSAHRIIAAIAPQTMQKRVFPVADANEATLDDSGRMLYFTRYGLHMTNDNARQYRGGASAQIWRYDLQGKGEAVNLFPQERSNNRRPMWWQNRLYFLSDRDGSTNLWSMPAEGGAAVPLTAHTDWDVRNPALGDGRIVYQLGADLHVLDLASQSERKLAIDLLSDFDQQRRRQIGNPLEYLSDTDLAAKQERLLLTARGHLYNAANGAQRSVEIALPPGARARAAVFAPDEQSLYAIVDASGEHEIWKFPADGVGPGQALTHDGSTQRWHVYPSPDGKWLAHTDKRGRLFLLDLATRSNQLIDDAGPLGISRHDDVLWSPDSKTLALVRPDNQLERSQIGLYDLAGKRMHFVTSDKYLSRDPAFSPDGRWLYFISERHFQASNPDPWGDRDMGPHFDKRATLYALALQTGNRFPFKPDDELSLKADTPAAPAASKTEPKADPKAAAKATGLPAIQYEGLATRLYQVPLAPGNYHGLKLDDKRLYFMESEGNEGKGNLKTLAIGKNAPQPEVFAAGIRSFDLSADKKHVYYRSHAGNGPGEFFIVEAGAKQPSDLSKAKLKLDDWAIFAEPRLEWRQMFNDAWRMHRDYLFDNKMRGVDWQAVRAKYAPLVERATDRAELNDVLALMAAEVRTLHSQVAPGELRRAAPEGQPAGLGAILTREADGYRIAHIYRSETELPDEAAPLAQPDLDVREGDLITAVNGRAAAEARDIADLLLNQAGKQVLLGLRRGAVARNVVVTPVTMDKQNNLRYGDWEQSRSERVLRASGGRIGYLHLRAMGKRDIASFAREFYSHFDRDGLIIDVRRNNGGNIDSWIIEKLLRKAWAFWSAPNSVQITNMQHTFRGQLVVLVDELTYSDGETFAAGIKALKLAPLVGKRTAGAGVWLSDQNRLVDRGMVRAAEQGQFGMDGSWLVEGVGVSPDFEVDNLPHATFMGEDQQLDFAIKLLEEKLRAQPRQPLVPQAIPPLK